MSPRLDRRYTAREVAEGLDVDLKHVRRWIRNGWLTARRPNRLNNRYRIRLAAIKRAMQHPMVLRDMGRRLAWQASRVSTRDGSRSPTALASPPVKSPQPPDAESPLASQHPLDDADE